MRQLEGSIRKAAIRQHPNVNRINHRRLDVKRLAYAGHFCNRPAASLSATQRNVCKVLARKS